MDFLKSQLKKQWFLVALVGCLASGFLLADLFQWMKDWKWITWIIAAIVMFLMAWPLEFGQLRRTMSRPLGPILASSISLILIPLMAWPVAGYLGPLLGPGLLVAAATPSTLATGAVWTRRAGGDDSVAIMVTLITNSVCFLVTPLWVYFLTGTTIPSAQLTGTIFKLLFFVVLPIVVAQLARTNRATADWVVAKKSLLSTMALIGILCIVFIGAINTGALISNSKEALFTWQQVIMAVIAVIVIHVTTFWLAIRLAAMFRLPRGEQIAVGFSGSQKTLMIGLSTSISLGFSIIPMIAYHSFQLIIGAVFADRIRSNASADQNSSKIGKPDGEP